MSCEVAIQAAALGKSYNIYPAPHDRLKQALVPRLYRAAAPFARRAGRLVTPPCYFREFWALRDVTFGVNAGETVGVIGLNGSGKSTLLQLVCGTLAPTTGNVEVRGRVAALLELGSGFNVEFSGRENVYVNGTVLGLTRAQIDEKLSDILAFADIGEFIDQPVKTYSSGMAMRLAFAVIAHVDADVLIIDEALAVGDAYFQQKCMRWLRLFRERGTVLFCGHDTSAVTSLCQKAIWLDHGKIRALGPAKEVCEAYTATIYARSTGLDDSTVRGPKRTSEPTQGTVDRKRDLSQVVEVLEFNESSAAFGTGEATVLDVQMVAGDGSPLGLIKGGEDVQVIIRVRANAEITNPIIGFHVKDRLGQPLFGDNTYVQYRGKHLRLAPGEFAEARFAFDLPFLQTGEYAITAAVASGTLEDHVQHHWLHDAAIIKIYSPYRNGVMIALPMHSIVLETQQTVMAE